MNRAFFLVAMCMILIALVGCNKDGPPTDPTLFNDGFRGITQTTVDPTPVGWVDPDDWKDDGYWDYRYPIVNCYSRATVMPKISRLSRPDTSAHPLDIA